jgi:hypothetical protein
MVGPERFSTDLSQHRPKTRDCPDLIFSLIGDPGIRRSNRNHQLYIGGNRELFGDCYFPMRT